MATHNFAVCNACEIKLPPENPSYCGRKCKSCYNKDRRDRYNNDENYHSKNLTANIERSKLARKKKADERKRIVEDKRISLEEKIGSENRICNICDKIVLKTCFRTGRLRCKSCENEYDRSRSTIVAAQRLHKLHTDPIFKFKQKQRNRISKYLKKSSKDRRTNEYLGCSSSHFYDWLKYNSDIYSFETHGKTWHIDHVIPISRFNLEDTDQQLLAFNWANTMPLSIEDNLKKGNNLWISQLTLHKQKLLEYIATNNITMPITYIELLDSHVSKLRETL